MTDKIDRTRTRAFAVEEVPLRIIVVSPPPDVVFAVQLGRDGLLGPVRSARDAVTFEFTLRLGPSRAGGLPTLRGAAAQGPPAARFIYLNSGRRAGDAASGWDRRAKLPLDGINAETVASLRATPGAMLEARVAGTAGDGGPACGTVPLLDAGWQVRGGTR
jgi:hypothetical protein